MYEYMPNGLLLNIYPQKKEDFSHLSGKSCMSLLCESLEGSSIYTREVMCAFFI